MELEIIDYFSDYNVCNTSIRPASTHKGYASKISFNDSVDKDSVGEEIIRLIKFSIEQERITLNNICVLAPQWVYLAGMTRFLVSHLPQYDFDGPGMVPFARDIENFWYKFSKVALTTASPEMYVKRIRWAGDVINELSNIGIDLKGLTSKELLKISNSIRITETNGLEYLATFFDIFFDSINIEFRRIPFLKEHYDAFFESSEARIQRIKREGAEFICDITTFRKVFKQKTGITISTIHGVKGAEFDTVIAYSLLDGILPHSNDPDRENSAKKML